MLRSIQKLIGDKRKQLIFPIFLMSLDAIGSLVMYLMLYFTVIHLFRKMTIKTMHMSNSI